METNISFTAREKEILQLIAKEKTIKEIAFDLHISVKTVGSHLKSIYEKTSTHSYSRLTAFCLRNNF
jgi:DNA-binding CsgD family transcriptional regulator